MQRVLSLFALLLLVAVPAVNAQVTLGAVLTGSQETPPNTSPGFGNATVVVDASHTSVTVSMTIAKLTSAVTLAHIHGPAPEGVAGNVELNLHPETNLVGNKLNATYTVPQSFGDELVASPQTHYVNVHTSQFGGGEIRGQLAATSGSLIRYAADLRGTNERPNPTTSTAVGAAFVTIDTTTNTLTFEVNIGSLQNPTLAHIHTGTDDVAGPVLVTFAGSSAAFVNGRVSGSTSIASLSAQTLTDLETSPQKFYVNVHSSAFGGGEIRGQLTPANEVDVPIAGKVTNGRGQNFVTETRIFNPSFDKPAAALVEYFQAGTSSATAGSSFVVNVPARGTAVLNDIAGTATLNKPGTTGGLRISSAEAIAATSNIFDDQRANNKGTLGQFVTAFPNSQALRRGVIAQLAHQTDTTSGFRTNVGFFNPSPASIDVRLELRTDDGTLLGTNTIVVPAYSQQQNGINVYFPGVDFTSRPNLTLSFDASAPLFAYGSLNDNVSADSVFIGAQQDVGVATAP
ncbi:MAG: CHRD domain-containing protein [Thermoanaerobaculia bacterium]